MKMDLIKASLLTLFLSACTFNTQDDYLPSTIDYDGQTFVQVTKNQIGKMQQFLYLPETDNKDPNNWQKGIIAFIDQSIPKKTLTERAQFRKAFFLKQKNILSRISVIKNELWSEIIYPPTDRSQNIQFEISQGKELECGYAQVQISEKLSASEIKWQQLVVYNNFLEKLRLNLKNLPWFIQCK